MRRACLIPSGHARATKNPEAAFARTNGIWTPGQSSDLYDNGSINGSTDAWTLNFGFVTSNTFTVSSEGLVLGLVFGAWVFPGDVLENIEVQITSAEFGGTVYSDQIVSLTQSGCSGNQYGFNVCTETGNFTSNLNLAAGTYWLNLNNAVVNDGDPTYWDENSGVGCTGFGCPSLASENSVGTIPSEAFTIEGSCPPDGCQPPPPMCFQSQGNLRIIHNFTQEQGGGGNGVSVDLAGNLYGANGGGDFGQGFVYKLTHLVDWLLDPLFSFSGGYNGSGEGPVFVGPNGSLYGTGAGGIQNCGSDGSQYCGLVFNLTPQPTACLTALCNWNEAVLYRFTSESDGNGPEVSTPAFDRQGDLYGITNQGGAHDLGTVFELSPSSESWTKTTLYSFTGGNDGSYPTAVLAGTDGNLYGISGGGVNGYGVIFQLAFSGRQWTLNVLHAFSGPQGDGYGPDDLVEDGAGDLYGILTVANQLPGFPNGALFTLQKTPSGWAFDETTIYHSCSPNDIPFEYLINLGIDTAGNLYGTGYGGETFSRSLARPSPGLNECFYNFIFTAGYDSNGWHGHDLDFLLNTYFPVGGTLAADTSGYLYGTTSECTDNNGTQYGTVWQLSP